jgi:hypothetical protein
MKNTLDWFTTFMPATWLERGMWKSAPSTPLAAVPGRKQGFWPTTVAACLVGSVLTLTAPPIGGEFGTSVAVPSATRTRLDARAVSQATARILAWRDAHPAQRA